MSILFAPAQYKATDLSGVPISAALLKFCATQTDTLQPVYSDAACTVQLLNPVKANDNGLFPPIYLDDENLPAYKLVPLDADGTAAAETTVDPYNTSRLSNKLSPGEAASGIPPVDFTQPIGTAARFGMKADNGTTDNNLALKNLLAASAGYNDVYIPNVPGSSYLLSGRVPVPAGTRMRVDGTLQWTLTVASGTSLLGAVTRPGLELMGDSFDLSGSGKILGPTGSQTFLSGEFGIFRVGAGSGNQGAAALGAGVKIRGVTIANWGQGGIVLQFVKDIDIEDTKIHDCGYQGMFFMSCSKGRIKKNEVGSIGPGTGGNAYGIAGSHDSRNYSTDPAVAGTGAFATPNQRQALNPFCSDFDVSENTVYDIPTWVGVDFHGAFDTVVGSNKVYNCYRGVQVSASSGDASAFAGSDNKIIFNTVHANRRDGSATTVANGGAAGTGSQAGFNINGGANTAQGTHRNVLLHGNTAIGCGFKSGGTNFAYEMSFVDAIVTKNKVSACYGDAFSGSFFSGILEGNGFGAAGQTANSRMIFINGNNAKTSVLNNLHDALGGNVYAEGLDINTSGATRMTVKGNDFSQATTPFTAAAQHFTMNDSTPVPRIADVTTGSHTIDVSVLGNCQNGYIEWGGADVGTLTSLLNGQYAGQIVWVACIVASTLTVDDSGNIKVAGGSIAIATDAVEGFLCTVPGASSKWKQLASLSNS